MKKIFIIVFALATISCGKNGATPAQVQEINRSASTDTVNAEVEETDDSVLTPEGEADYLNNIIGQSKASAYRFAQTTWKECVDNITGNYYGYNCSNSRNLSVILKTFLDAHITDCVNTSLTAQGGGKVADLHIVHAGITGDRNHSPRSNHAENRAIDIKSFEIKLTSGAVRKVVYEGTTNRTFYKAFRACWGEVIHKYNNCPYASGIIAQTGTIGWENADHQHHLHTSVPYCVGGKYSPLYFQR